MISALLTIDPHFVVGPVNRRLFGSFVEHLGRCVYDGIYEPAHPEADEHGFRKDVIELVKELGVTTIRYPGGNFVSGYRWEDGVGQREQRPRRLDLAWHSLETNEVGLDEFAVWLAKVGSELMYAVNLGTRGVQEALDVLEYANLRGGTELSERRIANGAAEPYDIRMWCLGNEMDGPWQLGHGSPEDYGRLAAKTARAMRQIDPTLELVVCGSSSAQMPLFGTWERIVLEETYDEIDFISCHAYYEPIAGDYGSFLASAVNMDRFIDDVVATADHVKAMRGSDKSINISFDEWNVWYHSRYTEVDRITDSQEWPVAPRLLEDVYSVVDAVVFGNLLISLHPARRPRDGGQPGAAGERDRPDHDRAGRACLAADDVLPVRDDVAARPRGDARAQARMPDVRVGAARNGRSRRCRRHPRRGIRRHGGVHREPQPRRVRRIRRRREPPGRRRPERAPTASTTTTCTPPTRCPSRSGSRCGRTRPPDWPTASSASCCPRSRGRR